LNPLRLPSANGFLSKNGPEGPLSISWFSWENLEQGKKLGSNPLWALIILMPLRISSKLPWNHEIAEVRLAPWLWSTRITRVAWCGLKGEKKILSNPGSLFADATLMLPSTSISQRIDEWGKRWRGLAAARAVKVVGRVTESAAFQEMARGFGVHAFRQLLASTDANAARLKTAREFADRVQIT
jgi:hypothetical protein